jgi:hypothetical protein
MHFKRFSIAIALLIALCSVTKAQEDNSDAGGVSAVSITPPPPKTKLEAFELRKNALIVRGYTEIGAIRGDDNSAIRIIAVELTDSGKQSKELGLVVEVSRGQNRSAISYVDYDEIDALADAMDSVVKLDRTATTLNEFEARFCTKGDLELTNTTQNGSRTLGIRATQVLLPTGQTAWATAHFALSRAAEIKQQILNAKQSLDRAKQL